MTHDDYAEALTMPIPSAVPLRIAVAIAATLSLWIAGASAKVHPVFQKEIDRVCTKVGQANTVAEVRAIDQADAKRIAGLAETARRNATFYTDHITAKLALEAAEARRKALDLDLADRLTPGRDENLRQAVANADKDMEPIRAKERDRDAADERIRVAKIARAGADVSADQAIVNRLNAEIARDKPALQTKLDDATKARNDNTTKIAELRRNKPAVYGAVDKAKADLLDAEKRLKQTVSLADELEETHSAVLECIDRRLVALDPASDTAFLQRYLDAIEASIAYAERQLRETNALCAQLPAAIQNQKGWADQVLQQSRDAARLAAVDPALVQQHDRVVLDAINGANRAAAEIAQTRARAQQAAADACTAAQAVERDPRTVDAGLRAAEAARHRAAAEKEVANAAAELQRIRAAYAAATLVSAQLAAVDDKPADAVSAIAATLRQLKQWQANLEHAVNVATPWKSRTDSVGAALSWLRQQPKARDFVERHRERIERLDTRHQALAGATDCRTRFVADIVGTAALVTAAEAQFNAIPAASKTPGARPTQSPATIEGIYNSARGVADGTAAEALKAVRCATAASVATQNLGIRCSYKRPDGSTIVVTLYDTQTCPKDIPAKFVDWKPEPKPDMMKDFGGQWFGSDPKFNYWTISGGTNVFSIVGVWRSDARPAAAKHDWTAECKRTAEGTNVAECTGNGKYWDADKNATYTFTLKVTLGSDGKYLSYNWRYGTVEFRTNAGEPRRHNDSIAPGRPDSGSMRR